MGVRQAGPLDSAALLQRLWEEKARKAGPWSLDLGPGRPLTAALNSSNVVACGVFSFLDDRDIPAMRLSCVGNNAWLRYACARRFTPIGRIRAFFKNLGLERVSRPHSRDSARPSLARASCKP